MGLLPAFFFWAYYAREGKSQLRKRKTLIQKVNYKSCKKLYKYYKIFVSG